jgi:hypothetical protein
VADDERPDHGAEDRADLSGLGRLSERPPPPRRERAAPIVRGLSILLLAIAAAGLPWYFFTQTDDDPTIQGSPAPTGSASATPTPSPTQSAATYEVFGVEACVNLRAQPGTTGERLDCLVPGIRLESDGQTQEASGLLWRHVHYARRNVDGWIADRYLRPVP